ncbi:MAG: glycosyl hydrolase 115 family protein [Opitutus sp.]
MVTAIVVGTPASGAVGDERLVAFAESAGCFPLVAGQRAATLLVNPADHPGVVRAARDLSSDIFRVTNVRPSVGGDTKTPPLAVIIGTLGRSSLVDQIVATGKLDVASMKGKWESFLLRVVDQPLPGIEQALVIVGSDKRGTIYGVYQLSEQIGVSPWYWWSEVPTVHRDALYVRAGRFLTDSPSVKYRGIFLNDEAPDLTNWIRQKFGTAPVTANPPVPAGIANYGREFYQRLFELILRLRGNYLWPAMWNNAFNEDDPENPRLADEYGIVMGTSHQEPMLRAQKEWDRRFHDTLGNWNYAQQPAVMQTFWREGVRRNKAYESIVTMGLRGANDTEMAPGGPAANRALLEQIVDVQRTILREEVDADVTQIPQLWCLYKEVQDFYEAGMRVPDDITLLWAEDNWGNVRRLPTAAERRRPGGAGVYYHFDYHGGPRSYQWLNTSPLPKIWEQMSLAKAYGADRIWIVNVGHFKGYELPMEYFLSLGWDTSSTVNEHTKEFTRRWAERDFGPEHASEIADILAQYAKFNGRRKPELLSPSTYSLVAYREAERVVEDYRQLAAKAQAIFDGLPASQRNAFYQVVLFPTKASALVNQLYLAAGKNALYARQGRASTAVMAAEVRRLFRADLDLMAYYNTEFAEGTWAHFMDQTHLGYTTWRDPPKNSLDAIPLVETTAPADVALGVAVEGSELAWGTAGEPASRPALPRFDALNQPRWYIDVFNRGTTPFEFTIRASEPWILVNEASGTAGDDHRIWVSVDWKKAPVGESSGEVIIAGAGREVRVSVAAVQPRDVTRESLIGFAELAGHVAIEPEHTTSKRDVGPNRWLKVDDYGRTLSGMRATAPVDAPSVTPGKNAPSLEYQIYVYAAGAAEVQAITAPTLNFRPGQPVRYGVSFDDAPPQIVELVPADYKAQNRNAAWEKSVADNAHAGHSKHSLSGPGYHTLKIWMVDPAVVMQKLVVDLGGLKPTYLGPPESYHRLPNRSE